MTERTNGAAVVACRDCGANWNPVRRGECAKCGSDAGSTDKPVVNTPEQWCEILGARILDHDGWRGSGDDWFRPIDREDFDRRLMMCTIDSRGYPSFWSLPAHPNPEPPTGDGGREGVGA